MSGLAEILLNLGHNVSGSDRQRSELTDYLEKKGAQIFEGHRAEHVSAVDFVVYSSAIGKDNPEMRRAEQLNIPLIRRAEMLGQFFNRKTGVAVAGTHGKTTTTSMIGHILLQAGVDPTIIVGGRLRNLLTNARLGNGETLVAEADEFDRSFLTLFPKIAVITSLEADHMDIYRDMEDLKNTFIQFANQTLFDGSVIVCIDDPNVREISAKLNSVRLTYGFSNDADFRAENIALAEMNSSFDVICQQKKLGRVQLKMPGEHNIKNALAAIVAASELDISFETAQQALALFEGVERRFEIAGVVDDVMIVDDYAHHPTEIKATLSAAKKGWKRRVVAVFQPHLYSRTRDFYREFAEALALADVAVVTDIYPARELPIVGVSGAMIADILQEKSSDNAFYVADKNKLAEFLGGLLQANDMLITLGAGDIYQVGRQLLKHRKG